MLYEALILLLQPATLMPPVVPDTVPAARRTEARQVQALPSGMGYEELRQVLARLRPVPTRTQPSSAAGVEGQLWREIDGLVVDETQTKMGRDFYQVFFAHWQPPFDARNYTLRVQEQPARGLGTRIVVLLDDEILFQLQLQPRYEVIEDLAQQAARFTRREVEQRRPAVTPAAAGDPPDPPPSIP